MTMTRLARISFIGAVLLLATAAPAAGAEKGGTGIGFDSSIHFWSGTFGPISPLTPSATTGLRFPIDITPTWQLEPNIYGGIHQSRRRLTVVTDYEEDTTRETTRRSRSFQLGGSVALKRLINLGPQTRLHLGVHTGTTWDHSRSAFQPAVDKLGESNRNSAHSFFAGPTIGAEYFLAPHFSIGFEGEIFARYGWHHFDNRASNTTKHSAVSVGQFGTVALRAYF